MVAGITKNKWFLSCDTAILRCNMANVISENRTLFCPLLPDSSNVHTSSLILSKCIQINVHNKGCSSYHWYIWVDKSKCKQCVAADGPQNWYTNPEHILANFIHHKTKKWWSHSWYDIHHAIHCVCIIRCEVKLAFKKYPINKKQQVIEELKALLVASFI